MTKLYIFSSLVTFSFLFWGGIVGNVQSLLLALHLGMTLSMPRDAGNQNQVVTYKARILKSLYYLPGLL